MPLTSGVYGVWDSGGIDRLDAHRIEIMTALVSAVAAMRDFVTARP